MKIEYNPSHLIQYPCLMRHKTANCIVLFVKENAGILIQSHAFDTVGSYKENWAKSSEWELVSGEVKFNF